MALLFDFLALWLRKIGMGGTFVRSEDIEGKLTNCNTEGWPGTTHIDPVSHIPKQFLQHELFVSQHFTSISHWCRTTTRLIPDVCHGVVVVWFDHGQIGGSPSLASCEE